MYVICFHKLSVFWDSCWSVQCRLARHAERSFSGLRRLKTWLRNSMSQSRLNAVAVSHVHQDVLDSIDITELAAEFASRSQTRRALFGRGHW